MSCYICEGLSDDDIIALQEVRTACIGAAIAAQLAADDVTDMDHEKLHRLLSEASEKILNVMSNYGGSDRASSLMHERRNDK